MAGRSRRASLDAAIELMYFAYRGMVAKPDRVLEARNLGRAHHRVLFFVARLERPTVGELLRTLAVSKQSLNGPLRDLKAQDLIAWERDEGDARVRRLSLTAAGRALEVKLSTLQRRQFRAIFAAAGAADEAGWRAVMALLAEAEMHRSGRDLHQYPH
jgi:DNA-binding MarR family transcriptional regulator